MQNDRSLKELLLWEDLKTKHKGKVCGSSSVLEQTLPNQEFSMDLRSRGGADLLLFWVTNTNLSVTPGLQMQQTKKCGNPTLNRIL